MTFIEVKLGAAEIQTQVHEPMRAILHLWRSNLTYGLTQCVPNSHQQDMFD